MAVIKILEIVSGLGLGGAEKALISRVKNSPSGVETHISNIRPQIDSLKPPPTVSFTRNFGNFFQNLTFVYRNIRILNPKIVIVRTPADVIRVAIIKKITKMKFIFVFEAHSNFVTKRKFFAHYFRSAFNFASSQLNGIIAVSESVKNGPLCKVNIPVRVCYLGSDIEIKFSDINEIEHVNFLFLGRLAAVKRPLWLIERVGNLKKLFLDRKVSLTIVGGGPLLEDAQNLVYSLGLQDCVDLVGQQSDVRPYLLRHNYLLSCSENEGLPISFFEAKLAGLRIITTPSGGGSEILDENDVITSTFTEMEFEAAIEQAVLNPLPSLAERRATSKAASWMSSETLSEAYYTALFDILALNDDKSDFLT